MAEMPAKKQKCIANYENVKKYIDSLPTDEQSDALYVLNHLEEGEFQKVLCKTWRKGIKEVYFKRNNRIYYVEQDKTIYLLYACRKQKNKTTKKDADIIIKRAKEL